MTRNPPSSATSSAPTTSSIPVDILILGAGWTSTFLLPLLSFRNISHAATSTSGRSGTIPFKLDPEAPNLDAFLQLPTARTVLITFSLTGKGPSRKLVEAYLSTHPQTTEDPSGDVSGKGTTFIQLGSTRIFSLRGWNDESTPYDTENSRAMAEDELLSLSSASIHPIVLNLAGLYGGTRQPGNWLSKVSGTKEKLREKEALHLIHGQDVARAILLSHLHAEKLRGKRWILTDLHVYDWWDLATSWDHEAREAARAKGEEEPEYRTWVRELMGEKHVKALPRRPEELGRVLDGRAFWATVGEGPERGHVLYETSGRVDVEKDRGSL